MRYSITTCICACFYTDLVHFSNYFIPKDEAFCRLPTSQLPERRDCPQAGRSRGASSKVEAPSSHRSAPPLIPAAAAAHCPEVLWSDEVGLGLTDAHTHTHTGNSTTYSIRQAWRARGELCSERGRGGCKKLHCSAV